MDELSGTENRIAVERMRYNERVQEYNTGAPAISGQPDGEDVRVQGIPVLPGAARGETGPEGQLQTDVDLPWILPCRGSGCCGAAAPPFHVLPRERYILTDFRLVRVAGARSRGAAAP